MPDWVTSARRVMELEKRLDNALAEIAQLRRRLATLQRAVDGTGD